MEGNHFWWVSRMTNLQLWLKFEFSVYRPLCTQLNASTFITWTTIAVHSQNQTSIFKTMTLALRGVVNDKRKITKWDDNEIFTSSNDCRCCHERIEEISKYCKYVTFHIWYKKFKTTKICSINYGAFQNIVRSQLPKNTARYDSCSWSINAQWMHSVNKFCSQEIAGDGQRFELQSCRQMLPCGRPGSRIPRVPDLWLQGCQLSALGGRSFRSLA